MHMWKKGGNSGKFGCLTRCTSFPPMTNVWFLSFKVWKAVWLWRVLAICLWYREENEWSCEEYAFSTVDGDSSRYVSFLHLLFCRSVDKLLNTIAPFFCFSIVHVVVVIFDALLPPSAARNWLSEVSDSVLLLDHSVFLAWISEVKQFLNCLENLANP